jgi:predicted amidohydrolase YtcJ
MALRRPLGSPETIPLPERTVTDRLRIDTVKVFADGGLSGATAALRKPYRGLASKGLLRLDTAELVELTRDAHLGGLRVATHVIGDLAIDLVLEAYEQLAALGPGKHHRLEHFGLPHRDQIERAARLHAVAAPQAIFLHSLGANFRRYLTDELLPRTYPLRDMLAAGIVVALSSDAPVVADEDPILGMRSAILRRDLEGHVIAPEQAITAEEALFAYTMGGALASGDDDNRGSLAPGKWADLAILSHNPLTIDPEALLDVRVQTTFLAGEPAYER